MYTWHLVTFYCSFATLSYNYFVSRKRFLSEVKCEVWLFFKNNILYVYILNDKLKTQSMSSHYDFCKCNNTSIVMYLAVLKVEEFDFEVWVMCH